MSELITDEIVEAAARAMYENRVIELDQDGDTDWDGLPESWRQEWREGARVALEAAASLIEAKALNEAADDWQRGEWANAPRRADRVQERIANGQHVGDWLRERAARLTIETEEPTT